MRYNRIGGVAATAAAANSNANNAVAPHDHFRERVDRLALAAFILANSGCMLPIGILCAYCGRQQ
jgi:hypothetical protein